jgi:hypothetical protein
LSVVVHNFITKLFHNLLNIRTILDDGWLIPLEKAEEEKAASRLNAEWEEKGPAMNRVKGVDDDIYRVEEASI